MKPWYDYDEASLATGLKPSTIQKYAAQGLVASFIRTYNAGWYHYRYRVIPASEILRLQAHRLRPRKSKTGKVLWDRRSGFLPE